MVLNNRKQTAHSHTSAGKIKIRGRQATPRQNREAKQIAVQSMRFIFLSVSCSPSSIKYEDVKSVLHKSIVIVIMVPTFRSIITNWIEACLSHLTPLVRN